MGCIHSSGAGGMKTRGSDTDTGVHFQADPKVHPEILQLAEVSYFGGGGGSAGPKDFSRFNEGKSVVSAVDSLCSVLLLDKGKNTNSS